MTELATAGVAFGLGLLGSVHCLGMCGGIMGALAMGRGVRRVGTDELLAYNLGRVLTYTLLGLLLGGAVGWLTARAHWLVPASRLFAAGVLLLMGLSIAGGWQGLQRLEQAGSRLWHRLPKPDPRRPGPRLPRAGFIGMSWGMLPCGLVYSALLWAGTQSMHAGQAALLMALFGLGTVPALMATGLVAREGLVRLRHGAVRRSAGLLIMVFAAWTAVAVLQGHNDGHAAPDAPRAPPHHSHPDPAHSPVKRP